MNTGGPRDPTAFMFLMPGVQSIGRWGNVMGGQDFTNDMYVEGMPITNAVVQGEGRNLSLGISVEAIDQFQVETSGTAVMFNGQGASNYVVKSGTNQFRASAFEFFRNKALDAKAFFADDQARRQPERVRRHGRRTDPAATGCSSSWPTTAIAIAGRPQSAADVDPDAGAAQRRFQRAAGDDLRSGDDEAEPERHRLRPRSVSRQHHPGRTGSRRSRGTSSRSCPPRRTATCRTTTSAASLPIGFNNDNVTGKVDLKLTARQQVSVLFAHGKRSQSTAVPRRRQRPDGAAAAVHGDAPRRGDARPTAQVKHTYVIGRALGEPGEPRVLAAVGADLQRHDRRALPDRGGLARAARGRSRLRVP